MNSRYSRIYTLSTNLYIVGAPVILCAGVLLQDHVKNRIVAQLKFKNISEREIDVLVISYIIRSASQDIENTVYTYRYEATASPDAYFGDRNAIPIAYENVDEFAVVAIDVVFSDGDVWSSENDDVFSRIPQSETLLNKFNDESYVEQFRMDINEKAIYYPEIYNDFWICSCGEIHGKNLVTCNGCGAMLDRLIECTNTDKLRERFEKRRTEETHKKKIKKRIIRIALACAIISVMIFIFSIPFILERLLILNARNKLVDYGREMAYSTAESIYDSDDDIESVVNNMTVEFEPETKTEDGMIISGEFTFTFPSGDTKKVPFSVEFDTSEWGDMTLIEKIKTVFS